MEARCEIFERLYILKGKLNLITEQVSSPGVMFTDTNFSPCFLQIDKNSAESNKILSAKVVYHESSSDEENSDEDAMVLYHESSSDDENLDEDDERGSDE